MYKTIQNLLPHDRDYPERQFKLNCFAKVLSSELYDILPYDFQTEYTSAGEYIPLRNRRPAINYNLCKFVVDDSVSMLFSEARFPDIHTEDQVTRDTLSQIIKESKINQLMIETAFIGSVGSAAIMFEVIDNAFHFKACKTEYLTPTWNPMSPTNLLKVREKFKVSGELLIELGYTDIEEKATYWWCREWNRTEEVVFFPWQVGDEDDEDFVMRKDLANSTKHNLGFVPVVWIKNLPGGDDVDGACTFKDAINTMIEIEYLISQGGRGLKYSSDPTLVIKDPSGMENGSIVKGAGNALIVSAEGSAEMLEINGKSSSAIEQHVKLLRDFGLEAIHGNRAQADKMGAATSGRAMELMNQPIIWLADKLRISYGEGALIQLLGMIIKASHVFKINVYGKPIGKLQENAILTLKWPAWYEPTATDTNGLANGLAILISSGTLSRETAIQHIAAQFDIEDVQVELKKIEADKQEDMAQQVDLLKTQAAVKPTGSSTSNDL